MNIAVIVVLVSQLIMASLAGVGFFRTLDWVEHKWGKKTALIVTLIIGTFVIMGIVLHPFRKP